MILNFPEGSQARHCLQMRADDEDSRGLSSSRAREEVVERRAAGCKAGRTR